MLEANLDIFRVNDLILRVEEYERLSMSYRHLIMSKAPTLLEVIRLLSHTSSFGLASFSRSPIESELHRIIEFECMPARFPV